MSALLYRRNWVVVLVGVGLPHYQPLNPTLNIKRILLNPIYQYSFYVYTLEKADYNRLALRQKINHIHMLRQS
jgi:hypothetical protein